MSRQGAHFQTLNGKPSNKKYSGMKKCDNIASRGFDGSLLNGKDWETDFLNTRHTENSLRYLLLLLNFTQVYLFHSHSFS